MSVENENITTQVTELKSEQVAELKSDWAKIQKLNGAVKASKIARAIQKYGFDISEKSEAEIDAICNVSVETGEAPKEKSAKKVTKVVETIKVTDLKIKDIYRYKTSETSYEVKEIVKNEADEIIEIKVEADNGKKWNLKAKRDITADVVKI